jgi:hypothetical protein
MSPLMKRALDALRYAVETESGNYNALHDPENPGDPDTEPAWMAEARAVYKEATGEDI